MALDVAAGARVAVPVPGAADALPGLYDPDLKAKLVAQLVELYRPENPAPMMMAS